MKRSVYLLFFALVINVGPNSLLSKAQPAHPDPLRFQQEIEDFALWDAKNSSPENAILFVGSSSIRFWNTADAFPQYPVINRGFGGSHISDLLYYFDRVIGRFDPSLIVFYCGENDIAAGMNPDTVFEEYTELLNRISETVPGADFLYVSIKPSSSRLEHSDRFEAFNRRVKAHNQSREQLHYIDLATPLTEQEGRPIDALFEDDQLHLNEDGYRLWNEKMREFLSDFR